MRIPAWHKRVEISRFSLHCEEPGEDISIADLLAGAGGAVSSLKLVRSASRQLLFDIEATKMKRSREPEEFHAESARRWKAAITELFRAVAPETARWISPTDCAKALAPFMGTNNNHALLPSGGGVDFQKVRICAELDCLEFWTGRSSAYIGKPEQLLFEHIEISPENSFFLLKFATLKPTGIYEEIRRSKEELLEIDGEYFERGAWDRGYLFHDETGDEVPLPDNARIITRFLSGSILIVSKGNIWNQIPETYDGRHSNMTSVEIRSFIEGRL